MAYLSKPGRIRLEIGGIALALTFSEPSLSECIEQRYHDFITARDDGFHAEMEIEEAAPGTSLMNEPIKFDQDVLICEAPGCRAVIDPIECRGELAMRAERPVEQVDYYLRLAVALLVYQAGGLLFHAAAVVRRGRGFAFFGYSGSGKSTVARLSSGDVVLNDDLVLLLPRGSGWDVFTTPFWNQYSHRPAVDSAPLAGLYLLVKSQRVFLEPLPAPLAVAEMLSCLPVINADSHRTATIVDRCQSILSCTPAYRLHFLLDASFWQAVDGEV